MNNLIINNKKSDVTSSEKSKVKKKDLSEKSKVKKKDLSEKSKVKKKDLSEKSKVKKKDLSEKSKIKKCENTFCNEYVKKVQQLSKDTINLMVEKAKLEFNKPSKNKSKTNLKDSIKKGLKDNLEKKIKVIKNKLESKEFIKESKKDCKNSFCNPKCKGTIFQNGEFPEELSKKFSKVNHGDKIIESLKLMRNKLMDGKKTIIEDNFYIDFKDKNRIQKKGAISGCALMSLL
jgi:hypothetical protein